jgi:DNA-binding response OmpR family regulator
MTQTNANVLIADDDRMIRSVLQAKFEAFGLTALVCADGQEAIILAARVKFALIILDLRMPKLNGLLVCEQIRKLPNNARTPVVMLTAIHETEAATAGERVGVTAFYTKPFRASLLVSDLSKFLPISHTVREAIEREAERARRISCSLPNHSDHIDTARSDSDNVLDRGAYLLGLLRGRPSY